MERKLFFYLLLKQNIVKKIYIIDINRSDKIYIYLNKHCPVCVYVA